MNTTTRDLSDGSWKKEVVNFFEQVFDRVTSMHADRLRFEADGDSIYLRFYLKRDILKSVHLQSSAFERIWQWMMEDGGLSYAITLTDPPTFSVRFPYQDGYMTCAGQRSKTLRQKSSLLLWGFRWVPKGAELIKAIEEELPLPLPPPIEPESEIELPTSILEEKEDELEKLRRKAQIDSGALQHLPRFRKSSITPKSDPGGKPVILIVEDQADQRQLMRMALEKQNYQVEEAADGEAALQYLSKSMPDGIITDLMMPTLDGSELVRRVKRNPELQHIPIMVFTVISDPSIEYDILDLGADDYCEKTESPKIFLKRLEKLIRKTQSGVYTR